MLNPRIAAPLAALLLAACGGGGGGGSSGSSSSGGCSGGCTGLPMANTVAGQPGYTTATANNGGVSANTVSSPQGAVATNGSNLFYVADTANNRILGFAPTPHGIAGSAVFVIGQSSFTDTAPGAAPTGDSAIHLNQPRSLSIADSGNTLVVADTANNRVLIWTGGLPIADNTAPSVVVGQPDFATTVTNYPSGTPGAASLSNPAAAFIAGGRLYVADTGNNRVLIWNSVPTASGTPANVVLGQTDFSGDNPSVDSFSGGIYILAMRQPTSVWASATRLLVVDSGNHRVLSWNGIPNVNNHLPDAILGQTGLGHDTSGNTADKFTTPLSVTSDGVAVFVADAGNNRVFEFANYIAFAGNGTAADHVFGQEAFINTAYNDSDQNGQPDTAPGPGTLHTPEGITIANGRLFVTDTGNNRVLGFVSTAGSTGPP